MNKENAEINSSDKTEDINELEEIIKEIEEIEEAVEQKDKERQLKKTLSGDDKPGGKEKFFSGFYTGMVMLATVVMIVLILVMLIGNKRLAFIDADATRYDYPQTNENVSKDMGNISAKIEYIASVLSTYYLEDVDDEKMIEGIYAGMVASLGDVYSAYLPGDTYEDLMEETEGVYSGIGSVVKMNDANELQIESITPGSPSEDAGLKPGDIFLEIDGVSLKGLKSDDAVTLMRGEEGSSVTVKIRTKEGEEKEITLVRKSVEILSATHKMLEDNIGYVQISGFEINTVEQFDTAIIALEKEGVKGLIIDLRGNPGGVLSSVSGIADRILPKGLVMYTEDKHGNLIDKVESTDDESIDLPIVVLIDRNSASASEVLAGAIKDRDAGKLVGKTTFGKGVVQSLVAMKDGSAIKLTTAKYYTPDGHYIHGKGIEPDVEVDFDSDKYYNDGIDTQLDKGIEVLKEMMK